MSMEYRPAIGIQSNPIIAISGRPGSGKTMGSLMVARGWVGSNGRIAQIDTEERRGSVFKSTIPGGYDTLNLVAPFTPERFIEAITAAEDGDYDIVVIDSASHEWSGPGGVTSMVEGKGLGAWKIPKERHQKFVRKILSCAIPVIICLRAAYKNQQGTDKEGKTVIVKDKLPTVIQEDTFIFEMTAHILTLHNPDGLDHPPITRMKKFSPPELRPCFPDDFSVPLSIETGQKIAAWATGEIDENTAALRDEARRYAKQGRDALQAWWRDLPPPARVTVNPIMDELKKLAAGASEARQAANPSQGTDTPADTPTPHGDPRDVGDRDNFGLSG